MFESGFNGERKLYACAMSFLSKTSPFNGVRACLVFLSFVCVCVCMRFAS